jgi:carbamoyltransferase
MIILGLNAYHGDAAACLVADGRLVAAAEEERFRRIKHWAGMPIEAIRFCLNEGNVRLDEIDHIAINRNPSANVLKKALFAFSKKPGLSAIRDRLKNASKIRDLGEVLADQFEFEKDSIKASIHHIEHHRAHLASTFYVSPFESAAIASVDGFGDFVSTMIAQGEGSKIQALDRITFPHSLGLFYLAMTQYLGFHTYGDEYKTMGLAAYGEPEFLDQLRRIVQLLPQGRFSLDLEFFLHHSEGVAMTWEGGEPLLGRAYSDALVKLLGDARGPSEAITQRHKNLAASLQALYEEAFVHTLTHLAERTGERSLCLAGGCALNSVANGHIMNRTPFERVYIPPAAGDDGGAVGAAFSVWHEVLGHQRQFVMDRADWGPEFHSRDLEQALNAKETSLSDRGCLVHLFEDDEKRCRWTAERLADGKIVGWFQGRMEWGARALGQRSILADPRRPEMKSVLNARIKQRESFRPFAPSILEEAVSEYFEQTALSPFMTMTHRVRSEKQGLIPATTHVDGTSRLQTVNRVTQPLYWQLIKEFEHLTSIPVLLNTSFNENEPIVCDPDQALACFLRTGMDALILGPYVIESAGPA